MPRLDEVKQRKTDNQAVEARRPARGDLNAIIAACAAHAHAIPVCRFDVSGLAGVPALVNALRAEGFTVTTSGGNMFVSGW